MKFAYIAAVAMTLVSAVAFTGCEKKEPTLGEKLEQTGKDVQKAEEKTAKDVEKAANKVADDVEKAANKVADDAKKAADDLAK